MQRLILALLAAASLPVGFTGVASAQAAPRQDIPVLRFADVPAGDSVLNDVYVQLYIARLRKAKLGIESAKQELEVAMKRRDRAEALYRKQALSAEELEEKRGLAEVAAIRVQQAQAEADEAETFVDIAVSRISIGLEMPICAEIR